MDSYRLSRFGMTCKPLTDDRGAELLTWWLAVSRARTYPLPEKAQESPENDQACGLTWRGSLAKYDPDSRSWKTAQLSLLGDSELSSVIWPRSGMTAGGQCWELQMLGRRTKESDFGSWPTPCRSDGLIGWSEIVTANREKTGLRPSGARIGFQLNYMRKTQPYVMADGLYHPNLAEWLMGWPLEWTALRPSGTARFHPVQQPHGDYSEAQHDVL